METFTAVWPISPSPASQGLQELNFRPIYTISFISWSAEKRLLKGDQEDLLRVAVAMYKNASLLSRVGEIFGEAFLKAYNLHLNWILTSAVPHPWPGIKTKSCNCVTCSFLRCSSPYLGSVSWLPTLITSPTQTLRPHLKCNLWLAIIGYSDLGYWGTRTNNI